MLGRVLRFNRELGYGFIVALDDPDALLPDFFVHRTFLENRPALVAGQTVEFDPVGLETPKPQARKVRVVTTTVARQVSEAVAKSEALATAKAASDVNIA